MDITTKTIDVGIVLIVSFNTPEKDVYVVLPVKFKVILLIIVMTNIIYDTVQATLSPRRNISLNKITGIVYMIPKSNPFNENDLNGINGRINGKNIDAIAIPIIKGTLWYTDLFNEISKLLNLIRFVIININEAIK